MNKDIMMMSERFRSFIDIDDIDIDIDEIANEEIKEIKKRTGLAELLNLILKNDISLINKDNYAKIFDMLHEYAFDNFNILLEKLNENRKNYCNINKLDGNYGLREIFLRTCICNKNKCMHIGNAILNYHPYCMNLYIKKIHSSYILFNYIERLITDNLQENFYLSLGWLFENNYINDVIKIKSFNNRIMSICLPHREGYPPFHGSNIRIAKILFKYGAILSVYNQTTETVIKGCDFEMIRLFVENGLFITYSLQYVMSYDIKRTEEEIIEIMEYLVEKGAIVKDVLSSSLYHGYMKVTRWVINAGETPETLRRYGQNTIVKYDDCVELLNMGFEPHEDNLERAIEKKDTRLCMLFLDHGVKLTSDVVNLAFDNNLKDVYMRMQDLADEIVLIDMAIRFGNNKRVIDYFDIDPEDKWLFKGTVAKYGDDELKKYFDIIIDNILKMQIITYDIYNEENMVTYKTIQNAIDRIKKLEKMVVHIASIRMHVNYQYYSFNQFKDVIDFLKSIPDLPSDIKRQEKFEEITIIASMKKINNRLVPNEQIFTDLEKARNFIADGPNSGEYKIDNDVFKNKSDALTFLNKKY